MIEFAAKDWSDLKGEDFLLPRAIDELRTDLDFQEQASEAVVAAIPFRVEAEAAE